MIKLLTLLISIFISGNLHSEENPFIIVNGLKTTDYTNNNGKVVIKNLKINQKNSTVAAIKIPKNNKITSVEIRNIRINSHNSRIKGNNELSGIFTVNTTKKTSLKVKNLSISAFSPNISNTTVSKSSCAAIYCQNTKGKVDSQYSIKAKGVSKFKAKIK